MTTGSYWVKLHAEDGRELGAGFYITRRYLLTAEHCLRRLAAERTEVTIVHEDGTSAKGRVCERSREADLALISLVGPALVQPPPAERCARGDRWRTPSGPKPSDPCLAGVIDEPSMKFKCVGGAQLEALQLRSETDLGSYSGYSGSAVERLGEESALAGVMLEQYFDRHDGKRAANVLFAVTMREAIERFADYFDHVGLISAEPKATAMRAEAVETMDLFEVKLQKASDWLARGLLAPGLVEMIQLDVARSVIGLTPGNVPR